MSIRRFVLSLIPLAALAATTSAEERRDRDAVAARMRSDVTYLASAECEGRGPGTAGIDKAADHIAAAFKEAGLKGAAKDGGYFQPFSVRGSAKFGNTTSLSLAGPEATVQPRFRGGFMPVGMAGDGKAHGELVFVGHGITAPDQSFDDYEGLDVTGKVVVMLRRTPRYNDKDRPFAPQEAMVNIASIAEKLKNAEKHKAAGVILVNDAATVAESGDDVSGFANFISQSKTVKIPVVHIKRHLVAPIVRAAYGKTLAELEEQIDRELKPLGKPLPGSSAALDVVIDGPKPIPVKNVVGVLEGTGPLADETVVIGAHYDHLGYGGFGSMAGSNTAIHHGADDNASGSTAIIELARRFAAMKEREGRRLVFLAFSAEEMGLLGSAHYCKEPLFPLDKTVAMLNLDMVGRVRPDKDTGRLKIDIGGTGTAKELDPLLERLNGKYNFKMRKTASGKGPSDHQSFYYKNIPVLFFFTGFHTDYHRPSDTADKINVEGMAMVADMVEDIATELTTCSERPEFVEVKGPGFSPEREASGQRREAPMARLGVMPDYNDEGEGVRIEAVSPDGAAKKAGIKEGDRVVEIDGKPVKNITAYMSVLRAVEKGKEIEVVVKRGEEKVTVKVTPVWGEPR